MCLANVRVLSNVLRRGDDGNVRLLSARPLVRPRQLGRPALLPHGAARTPLQLLFSCKAVLTTFPASAILRDMIENTPLMTGSMRRGHVETQAGLQSTRSESGIMLCHKPSVPYHATSSRRGRVCARYLLSGAMMVDVCHSPHLSTSEVFRRHSPHAELEEVERVK